MEDPKNDIPDIIHLLTQSPPSLQRRTIDRYFTRDASFTHPFCRTGRWSNSRLLVAAVYRWYKIMSPRIDLRVNSVAYDETNLILYVNISQVFRIWIVPFYSAPVNLTTVIHLQRGSSSSSNSSSSSSSGTDEGGSKSSWIDINKSARGVGDRSKRDRVSARRRDQLYYIRSQDDLYQVDEWIRFLLFGGFLFVRAWQALATLSCVIGVVLLAPVSIVEEKFKIQKPPLKDVDGQGEL
jgi:hypothetical protein